ncbi:heme NO-binding domain-containing protein [Magnetococcus sp. PR-3]|uniref:heme NO-binding domain-containing protein n=1 Tax=Magnetococcus sp. PR-3 TaxID=3120355 RepID=UPI002FCDE4B1
MLGIVFSEFEKLVEEKFSMDMLDDILDEANLDNDGAFTAVGSYPFADLAKMVGLLSKHSGIPVPDLVEVFGGHLFTIFHQRYAQFFEGIDSSLTFLEGIEDTIHTEVQKLYPEAELPTFTCTRIDDQTLQMHYQSRRPLAPLALGLIRACVEHFGQPAHIRHEGEANDMVFTVKLDT